MTGRRLAALGMGLALVALWGCAPIDRPAADFTSCPAGGGGRLEVIFTSTSVAAEGRDIVRAVWEFGDGSLPEEGTGPIWHLFPAPGVYAVALTVTDRRGVRGTVTRFVDVQHAAFVDPTWRLVLGAPPTVAGVVGNAADVLLRVVVVRVRFYDADGVRLGDERASVFDLEPRERARFEVSASDFWARLFYAAVEVESYSAACDPVAPVRTRAL